MERSCPDLHGACQEVRVDGAALMPFPTGHLRKQAPPREDRRPARRGRNRELSRRSTAKRAWFRVGGARFQCLAAGPIAAAPSRRTWAQRGLPRRGYAATRTSVVSKTTSIAW